MKPRFAIRRYFCGLDLFFVTMRQEFYIALVNLMFLGIVLADDCKISIYDVVSLSNRAIVDDSDPESTSVTNHWQETYGMKFQARYARGWNSNIERSQGELCDKKKDEAGPMQKFIGTLFTEITGLSNCWDWTYDQTGKGSREVTLPCDEVKDQLVNPDGESSIVIALVDRDGVGYAEYTGTLVKM